MSWLDNLAGGPTMEFPFGESVFRDRRRPVPNPANPDRPLPGSWDDVDTITVDGAFVASSSSMGSADATRSDVLTAKSLYCHPASDVKVGDRIRRGSETYYVHARPEADVNPFTGWHPVVEIPLEMSEG
ncbi:hypothetical protein GCM10022383_27090 [Microbacterium soli]|uniref:Head-to-tail stopper n=2 Tax=Microbacterium soli TaxID=446075 RepID=A0ABP7NIG8_9MICO